MTNVKTILNNLFKSYTTRTKKWSIKLDIAYRKQKYEETLDKLWEAYCRDSSKVFDYNKQLGVVTDCGYIVDRDSKGKHNIELY